VGDRWHLIFVGRMYTIKGGREFLHALPKVIRALQRPLHVTFAGDGAQRAEWEERASALRSREPMVDVEFTGWLQREELARLYSQADLVVMPSLWPEPFGLVGWEAGLHGVPVAAFAVGGIPDWLQPGVNGHLASGSPPTVNGLADAIIGCLQNEDVHARLRAGARRLRSSSTFEHHLTSLLDIFEGLRHAA
jgi:glycosyltransferase involved in cell wall biosynthesis